MFKKRENLNASINSLKIKAKGMSLLIVEDDPLIAMEYANFFGNLFDKIEQESNGLDGLNAALDKHYDLIVTDVCMPGMDGINMIKEIKKTYPNQPTLLLSAHQDSDLLYKSVQVGVDGYLFKPIDIQQIIETLDKILTNIIMDRENKLYKENLEDLVVQKSKEVIETYTIDNITKAYSLAKLQQDIAESNENSLIVCKIKNFKTINDFYGYETGNKVLKQTAELLKTIISENTSIESNDLYRISGAHFAILSSLNANELAVQINKVIEKFESIELNISEQHMYLEMIAGIVCHTDEISISKADSALRMAEKNNKTVIYEKDEKQIIEHSLRLQCHDNIKRALNEDRFVPYYHPIIDNETNTIKKYEALARMIMPDGTVVYPNCFLPVSKQAKTYNMITLAIIKQALDDFRDSECCVSLNLSVDDIQDNIARNFIFDQIANFPDPSRLVFELLESENIESYNKIKEFFSKLKELGCKVAIDDFGSGYANFEYIAKLNIDYIKIDGSLISGVGEELASLTIVEMLSEFASKMEIKTIAEYVSSDSIRNIVNSIGINESQGFLFGQPIPYNDSMKYIQTNSYSNVI